jgi:hypothetical protein
LSSGSRLRIQGYIATFLSRCQNGSKFHGQAPVGVTHPHCRACGSLRRLTFDMRGRNRMGTRSGK